VGARRAPQRRARGVSAGGTLPQVADEVQDVVEGDGYALANIDALAEGPGFRKVRRALGVTAFGVNAIELPPGYETGRHYHDRQEELYFVHRGRIEVTLGDEATYALGPGGAVRVDAATVRKIKNVGDEPAVYLAVGGEGGYVGRDGRLPEGETTRFGPSS
jgi:mannose-6-phosphate isomerase-like protein (cupin superfamily)